MRIILLQITFKQTDSFTFTQFVQMLSNVWKTQYFFLYNTKSGAKGNFLHFNVYFFSEKTKMLSSMKFPKILSFDFQITLIQRVQTGEFSIASTHSFHYANEIK